MSDLQMLEALNRTLKRETELAALKERLKGLSAKWRNTHDAITCAKAAADLDAVIGDADGRNT